MYGKFLNELSMWTQYTSIADFNQVHIKERNQVVDLPIEEWDTVKDTTIYITEHRKVNDSFYRLICAGDVYSNKLKLSENDGITRFEYKIKISLFIALIIILFTRLLKD